MNPPSSPYSSKSAPFPALQILTKMWEAHLQLNLPYLMHGIRFCCATLCYITSRLISNNTLWVWVAPLTPLQHLIPKPNQNIKVWGGGGEDNFQNLKLGRKKNAFRKNFRALVFHLLSNLLFCPHLRAHCFLQDKVVRAIKHPDGKISDNFFLPAFGKCFGFLTDFKGDLDSLPQRGSRARKRTQRHCCAASTQDHAKLKLFHYSKYLIVHLLNN